MIFAAVAMRDGFSAPAAGVRGEGALLPDWLVLWGTLLPLVAVAVVVEGVMRLSWRALARCGQIQVVDRADAVLSGSRWCIAVIHVVAVLGLGWLDLVRSVVGDWVLVDEVIAVIPALAAGALGWWSYSPIALTVRDASLMGALERGEPVYPPMTRRSYVSMQVRHGIGFIAVPMTLIAGWTDVVLRLERWAAALPAKGGPIGSLAHDPVIAPWVWLGVRVAGVATVFIVAPGLMRYVWSTMALGPGPTRDRLVAMCAREGVRVREILVWRTHGTIVNGAVMGIVAPLRFVLLTDAMLDRFDGPGLEAVMAHEVGHVRRRHIPWLAAVMLVSLMGGGVLVQLWLQWVGAEEWDGVWVAAGTGLAAGGSLVSLVLALAVFGWVSRRFEWQADAFAVQHLTKFPVGENGERGVEAAGGGRHGRAVSPEAAAAMIGTLEHVARINHIPRWKWTFRHGSIGERQRRLKALVGRPVGRLGIDRTVGGIKLAAAAGIVLLVAAAVFSGVS